MNTPVVFDGVDIELNVSLLPIQEGDLARSSSDSPFSPEVSDILNAGFAQVSLEPGATLDAQRSVSVPIDMMSGQDGLEALLFTDQVRVICKLEKFLLAL